MFYTLTGDMYSGKTTLALALKERGFQYVSFTDLLKRYAVEALTACGMCVTLEEICSNKHLYRSFLQELGAAIGFDNDPRYIKEVLASWSGGPIVFDNVRTVEQWRVLGGLGFVLVEVRITEQEQRRRAAQHGVSPDGLHEAQRHSVEGCLRGWGDIVLDGSLSPQSNASKLEKVHGTHTPAS